MTAKGGCCYGMSATAGTYYIYNNYKPNEKETFSMQLNDAGVRDNIVKYQRWEVVNLLDVFDKNTKPHSSGNGLQYEYNEIEKLISEDGTAIINIMLYHNDGSVAGGHAVLAYNTYSVSNNLKNVIIYDSNYPGMANVIQFDLKNNQIKYEPNLDYYSKYVAATPTIFSLGIKIDDYLYNMEKSLVSSQQ